MTENKESFQFQAEARQILDMMIYSVYSNKDIFLREMISNASDALDKMRFQALTDKELEGISDDLHIRLDINKENRILSVQDNGIGMNKDDIIAFIGTIAKSGTKEYLKMLQQAEKSQIPELIGQFGIGFYSAYMVAESIHLLTRKAGETQAWEWESGADGSYTISEATREIPGTTVTLRLKDTNVEDGLADYTSRWKIEEIVKKYSDFVTYPIRMQVEEDEYPKKEDGAIDSEAKPIKVSKDLTLNSMKAIWTRSQDEVKEEEYNEFYKHISHDWNSPMQHILYSAEGTTEFKALLFIPDKVPFMYNLQEQEHGIDLYIKRIFIMSNCENLIPRYLRFVRGIVDSEDLPLNLSREMIHQSRMIKVINKNIVKKLIREFKNMLEKEREQYIKFWHEFGKILKEGVFQDYDNVEKILEISMFDSSHSDTELTTLDEYVSRMKEGQEQIYLITGPSREMAAKSPHVEGFLAKGFEVLYLSDPVDEVWLQSVKEYKSKKFQLLGKGQANLDVAESEQIKDKEEKYKTLLEFIKGKLEQDVREVRLSTRLTESPACLVGDESDMSPHLVQLMRETGQDIPKSKLILEINPDHEIIVGMQAIFEQDKENPVLASLTEVIYGQAILAEGSQLDKPAEFSKKLTELMLKVLGSEKK